jgi:CheY-like chemotaxis protein
MADTRVLSGKRLIVIEDNPVVRMGVEDTLRGAGAIIVKSFNQKADAAVLDVRLGGGVTAIPIALTLGFRSVPFMFYTGQPETTLAPIRNRWPGCKIVTKPSSPREIIAAVVDLLTGPAMRPPQLN